MLWLEAAVWHATHGFFFVRSEYRNRGMPHMSAAVYSLQKHDRDRSRQCFPLRNRLPWNLHAGLSTLNLLAGLKKCYGFDHLNMCLLD